MEEMTEKMIYAHTTTKGWKVFHGIQANPDEIPLIRDIYLAQDGQLPEDAKVIGVTLHTDEKKRGVAVYMTGGTPKTVMYRPLIDPKDPLAKSSILVVYINRNPDLPLKLRVSIVVM